MGVFKKILDINCHEVGVDCQDDAAKEQLHCGQAHCECATISWVVGSITPYSELCAEGVALVWVIINHYSPICDVFPPIDGDILLVYKKIVFVPSSMPGTPCANCPISLA